MSAQHSEMFCGATPEYCAKCKSILKVHTGYGPKHCVYCLRCGVYTLCAGYGGTLVTDLKDVPHSGTVCRPPPKPDRATQLVRDASVFFESAAELKTHRDANNNNDC